MANYFMLKLASASVFTIVQMIIELAVIKSERLLEYIVNLIDNANSRSCHSRKSAIKDDRFGSLTGVIQSYRD